jgi:hypothetical protein
MHSRKKELDLSYIIPKVPIFDAASRGMPRNYAVASGRGLLDDDAQGHGLDRGRARGTYALERYMETGSAIPASANNDRGLEAVMSTMMKARNLDCTVDRVADPPPELHPILYAIRCDCEIFSADLHSLFVEAGGKGTGLIASVKFFATLKGHTRHPLTREVIALISAHYGVSWLEVRSEFENMAWKDFCADVQRTVRADGGPRDFVLDV